jgi:hypothetical protein
VTDGSLVHDPEHIVFRGTGLEVADFVASVECFPDPLAATALWDCGFDFRYDGNAYFRIVYFSNGSWIFFDIDGSEQSGAAPAATLAADQRVTLTLIADGDKGYFGVNDQYLATFDLSGRTAPGALDLGSAFYPESTVEGGAVNFDNFGVWSIDSPGVSPTLTPEPLVPTPSPAVVVAAPTETATDNDTSSGSSYVSEAYGYSLTWPDGWTVGESSPDRLTLTNGEIEAGLLTIEWPNPTGTCLDYLIAGTREIEAANSSVIEVLDTPPSEVWDQTGIILVTPDAATTVNESPFGVSISCSPIPDSNRIVFLGQEAPLEAFDALRPLMDQLSAGFSLGSTGTSSVEAAEAAFFAALDSTTALTPKLGPQDGEINQAVANPGTLLFQESAADLVAIVDIVVPEVAIGERWDATIGVRDNRDNNAESYALIVSSEGNWQLVSQYIDSKSGTGLQIGEPGSSVRLELVVTGGVIYAGFNGELLREVELAEEFEITDLTLRAKVYGEYDENRLPVTYQNLTIWELSGSDEPAVATTGWSVNTVAAVDLGDLRPIALSPDGRLLAATDRSQLCVYAIATAAQQSCADLSVLNAGLRVADVSWSPDSTRLLVGEDAFAVLKDSDIWVMDAATGELTNLTDEGYDGAIPVGSLGNSTDIISADISPTWTQDGTGITFSRSLWDQGEFIDNYIATIPATGEGSSEIVVERVSPHAGYIHNSMRWTADGTYLYYSTWANGEESESGIFRVDATDGSNELVLGASPEYGPPALVDVSATGEHLIIWYPQVANPQNISKPIYALLDVATGELTPLQPAGETDFERIQGGRVTLAGFSPDGTKLLTGRSDAAIGQVLWVTDLETGLESPVAEEALGRIFFFDYAVPLSWSAQDTTVLAAPVPVGSGLVLQLAE